jgi:hypothetical protein
MTETIDYKIKTKEIKDGIVIESIKLIPKQFSYNIPAKEDIMPTEYLRKEVAYKLAEQIVNRLHYEKIEYKHGRELVHSFSIWSCNYTDRDYYVNEISNLNKTIARYISEEGKLEAFYKQREYEYKNEINKYKKACLWDRIKYIFKGEIK